MYIAMPEYRFADLTVEVIRHVILNLNIQPGPGGSHIMDLPMIESGQIVEILGWKHCRVAALWPSSQIVLHQDQPISEMRLHIPIQNNKGCWSYHDGVWQPLMVGMAYKMDPSKPHGSVNWGETIRYHLVLDLDRKQKE